MKKNRYKRPFIHICNINSDYLLAGSYNDGISLTSAGNDSGDGVGQSKNAIFSDDGGNGGIW